MKKSILCLATIMMLVMLSPSCKTAEFVWNPVGDWTLVVSLPDWGDIWNETVSFAGTESGGTLTGWALYNPLSTAGTWSKTGDYTVTLAIDFWNVIFHNIVNLTATSSEGNPNFMTGTGQWTEIWIVTNLYDMSFTATKTTNLQ